MRRLRLASPFSIAFASTIVAALSLHCGSKESPSEPTPTPTEETSSAETLETGEETSIESGVEDTNVTDAPLPDVGPETPPVTVTCTKAPAYGAALRVSHNPDSLRHVANGAMVLLDDGRILIAFLEAIDTSARYALYARLVEPATGKIADDERLDVDADALTKDSRLELFAISGGAVGARYGDGHLKVFSRGKWSPDIASAGLAPASSDALGYVAAPNGTVLVTRAKSAAPSGQAIVFRPDEGGIKGSWSTVQTLDLDGGSGTPRIDRFALADSRFVTLVWQGAGGPSVRVRSVSGAWTAAGPKAEIGATDASPSFRLLDDGTIVLVALEGTGETRRAVTSTWTSADGWSTARLLSKLPGDVNGVLPNNGQPFLFGVSGKEVEFVAWVAACAGAAKDCEFHPVSRRYSGGAWKDPVDLKVGTETTGPDGLSVQALGDGSPLLMRTPKERNKIEIRVRFDADYKPLASILADSPLFNDGTQTDARFYGGRLGLWSIARRDQLGDAGTTLTAAAMGKIDPAATPPGKWGAIVDGGGAEMRTFAGDVYPYADGGGGFTVGVGSATDGSTSVPIIAHSGPIAGTPEIARVVLSDEKSARFANVPRSIAREGRDRSALYTVTAVPSEGSGGGVRLRAYAWNSAGSMPKLLANESRSPRTFADGMLVFGCGGAVLYAIDPDDGSHSLQLVIVREADK